MVILESILLKGILEMLNFVRLVKEHPKSSGLSSPGIWEQSACRSHLKNVFWPNIFVGAAFRILDIQQYASGSELGPAAILNQNPIFEMASIKNVQLK
jgi:hypothetical protein